MINTDMTNTFFRSSRLATKTFNQSAQALYRNNPRVPFEYYISISLNNLGTARNFISQFFNNDDWQQMLPLVKTVDMPSMKIDTTVMNQYNRKRLSQSKLSFDPIKMVFHDVADGKTLKFWEMYYRYYFGEGNEPGVNSPKQGEQSTGVYATEEFGYGAAQQNSNFTNGVNTTRTSYGNSSSGLDSPTNTLSEKSTLQNIISTSLDNHNFGYNLPVVNNIRNLIQSIEIYQVHGGRYNKVVLVNPRISGFTHDTLNYAAGDRTLEVTFTLEYEYAYYSIENMELGGTESGNNSSSEPFENSGHLELPSLSFTSSDPGFIQGPNPAIPRNFEQTLKTNNIQTSMGSVIDSRNSTDAYRRVSSSVLDGVIDINPPPVRPTGPTNIKNRPFVQTAPRGTNMYIDVNRTGDINGQL